MRGLGLSRFRDADASYKIGHHCVCDCQQHHRDFVRLEQPARPEPIGEGIGVKIVACLRHARTRALSAYPTRNERSECRVGLLKYRVSDTRSGVGQDMSTDIIRCDGCPLRIPPRADMGSPSPRHINIIEVIVHNHLHLSVGYKLL